MKNCTLSKWFINIILWLLFWALFFIYTWQNKDNLIICSSDTKKVELCKTHLEKWIFDYIIPKNDVEKINTTIVLSNWSKTYDFFDKYISFIGFWLWIIAILLVFLLNWLKFVIWLWKYKIINAINLFIIYFLVFLLWLNFLYWEPRFTEIWVASSQFFWHSITLISFYYLLIIFVILILHIFINLFSNKKENEKTN